MEDCDKNGPNSDGQYDEKDDWKHKIISIDILSHQARLCNLHLLGESTVKQRGSPNEAQNPLVQTTLLCLGFFSRTETGKLVLLWLYIMLVM